MFTLNGTNSSVFHVLAHLMPLWIWGVIMLVNAALLGATILLETPRFSGFVAYTSAGFWMFVGFAVCGPALFGADHLSAWGAFSIFGGFKFLLASAQLGSRY